MYTIKQFFLLSFSCRGSSLVDSPPWSLYLHLRTSGKRVWCVRAVVCACAVDGRSCHVIGEQVANVVVGAVG